MLFKILKGESSRIGFDNTPFNEGNVYFTSDDGGLYIDSLDSGVRSRVKIGYNGIIDVDALPTTGINDKCIYRLRSYMGTLIGRYSKASRLPGGQTFQLDITSDGMFYGNERTYRWCYFGYSDTDGDGSSYAGSYSIALHWTTPCPGRVDTHPTTGNRLSVSEFMVEDNNGPLVRYTDSNGIAHACYINSWNASVKYSYYFYKSGVWKQIQVDASDWHVKDVSVDGTTLTPDASGKVDVKSKPNTYIKQLADYLYEIQFSSENTNQQYCFNYFHSQNSAPLNAGACTGVYYNGKALRHYDWYYDNTVEFLVRKVADRELGTYASIGISSALSFFTKDLVGKNGYDERYKLIPYAMCDGINEHGMFVQSNVVPRKKDSQGNPIDVYVAHTSQEDKGDITYNMITRIILDNCKTVNEAKVELTKYDIYRPVRMPEAFDMHLLLGDADGNHCVLEFSADGASIIYVNNGMSGGVDTHKDIMTNFNCAVGVLTDFELDYDAIGNDDVANIGMERFELCAEELGKNNPNIASLRSALMYTNLYNTTTNPYWYSEFCGQTTEYGGGQIVLTPHMAKYEPEKFSGVITRAVQDYANRYRGDGKNWQTVHSVLYDLTARTMDVVVQERTGDATTYYLNDERSKYYVFTQAVSSNEWTVTHNLGRFPSVSVVDSGNNVVVGDIQYINENSLAIRFTSPFSGSAYLN